MEMNFKKDLSPRSMLYAATHKRLCTNTRCIGKPSDTRFVPHDYRMDEGFVLKKQRDRDFIILNITDTHFADYDIRALMAYEVEATFTRLVKAFRPDLITVTGDLICSDNALFSIRRLCRMFERAGVPWAPVFGNHDDETNMDLNWQAELYMSCPHCLFKKGDPAMGVGNYTIHIVEEGPDGVSRPVETLFMADSRHSQLNARQLAWIDCVMTAMEAQCGAAHEAALFCHIPLPEYQAAYDLAWNEKEKLWRSSYKAVGEKHEEICCERRDGAPVYRGVLDALKQHPTMKHVICGHEHLNNFSIEYEGVRLTYTMKIGRGSGAGYGLNGGTLLRIGENGICELTHKEEHRGRIADRAKIVYTR